MAASFGRNTLGRAAVFVARHQRYDGDLQQTVRDGLLACGLAPDDWRGKRVLLKPNLVEPSREIPHMTTHPAVIVAVADVFLARAGLDRLTLLFHGSWRTMGVIRRNLVFSLLYNVVGAALAMTGLIGPLVAAVLMPLSSLTVITLSLRARTF